MEFAREQVELGLSGVNRICFLCGISKATYYHAKEAKDRFLKKYQKVKKYVEKVIDGDSNYGIRRIKKALEEDHGIIIGRDVLAKLLVLWGLNLKRRVQKKPKPGLIGKILIALSDRTNLLIRTKITRPLQALTSDICELTYKGGKVYFCVHKDVFGQIVYGWKVSQNMNTFLVKDSLDKAVHHLHKFPKRFIQKILIHQDRGSQYTSYEYVDAVLKHKMTLSYSAPGTPTDNPGQESFFGRFKAEWADEIKELETFEEVEKFIAEKVKYYNTRRIHTSIGYTAPKKFTKKFLKS